jgi:hypothetical protein
MFRKFLHQIRVVCGLCLLIIAIVLFLVPFVAAVVTFGVACIVCFTVVAGGCVLCGVVFLPALAVIPDGASVMRQVIKEAAE